MRSRDDALTRLATVSDASGGVYAHAYDNVGNRASLAYPNGVTTSTLYDPVNRLSLLATAAGGGTTIQSYAFTLDATGRRERIDEHDGTARSYTYDALYRLTRDRVTDAATALVYEDEFVYDPVGNRLSLTRDDGSGPAVTAYAYDTRDRLLTEGPTAYTWDANGNLTAKTGIAAYGWDPQDRLTTATLADGTEVVTHYDPDGNRVRTETTPPDGPTETVDYLVDTWGFLSHVVVESDGAGNVLTHYTRGDELLSLYRPTVGERKYFHADGIGSVRALTDVGGTVTDRYAYTAFGVVEEHLGSDPQPYRFTGEPFDSNTGLQYHRARWLHVGVGQFLSTDPAAGFSQDPVSLHRYLYATADVVNSTDPTGRFSMAELNVVSSIINTVSTIGSIYTALRLGYGVGTIINGLLIEESLTLDEAADEARELGIVLAINYMFNFGGIRIGASIVRKLGNVNLIRLFSAAKVNGRLAEHFIGNSYGMLRNTTIRIGRRLPDFINSRVIREIKNVKELRWSGGIAQQLRDYAREAVGTNRKFFIHVRPGTRVSPAVETELTKIFGRDSKGKLWDVIRDVPEHLRVVP